MLTSAEELGVWVTCERLCYTHASTLPEFASVCHLHSSSCALSSAHLQRKRVGSLGCHPSPSCRACRSFPRGTQMVLGAEGRADAAERAKKWPEDTRAPGWVGWGHPPVAGMSLRPRGGPGVGGGGWEELVRMENGAPSLGAGWQGSVGAAASSVDMSAVTRWTRQVSGERVTHHAGPPWPGGTGDSRWVQGGPATRSFPATSSR